MWALGSILVIKAISRAKAAWWKLWGSGPCDTLHYGVLFVRTWLRLNRRLLSLPQTRLRRGSGVWSSHNTLIRITRSLAHSRMTIARAGNPELGERIPSPAQGWPGNNKIINEMLNCSRLTDKVGANHVNHSCHY